MPIENSIRNFWCETALVGFFLLLVLSGCWQGTEEKADAALCRPAPFFDKNMSFVTRHHVESDSSRCSESISLQQGIDVLVTQVCGPPRKTVFEIAVYDDYSTAALDYPEEAAHYFYQIAGIAPDKLSDLEEWSKELGRHAPELQDGRPASILGHTVRVVGAQSAQSLRLMVEMIEGG